ncbi:hypothetical protein [Zeimonas arvi]|uniref:Uncharacterized protein n=1 Tax=Zeimonas arvi TaxID=2498847 RepID=A0A5C8P102_9BURK|nr:hypothetical protein [Zeimonas arvi]TXL67275.1 hypothetical protein FHP08_06615 [Zeimonas arvi]
MEVRSVELQLDTCIHWLEIAVDRLDEAHTASVGSGNREFGEALDREFKAAMQATVAAATFFEALYAATIDRDPPPRPKPTGNPKKRRTRYMVVAEQLRRSFGLRKQGTTNLRSVLKEVYRFRDQAVHPGASFSEPIMHPQFHVGVENRFVMFSAPNAHLLVRAALAFSRILPSRDLSRRPKGIQEFGAYLLEVSKPLCARWEQEYGPLLEEPAVQPSEAVSPADDGGSSMLSEPEET